jgi:transcriptional regulator with XRE-family HTH domain
MPQTTLSKRLRSLREARGLTQEEMARRIGVEKSTLWRWEHGLTRPKGQQVLQRVKDEYGLTQEELETLFVQWAEETRVRTSDYTVLGYDYIILRAAQKYRIDVGLIDEEQVLEELLKELIVNDVSAYPHITPVDEGDARQWAPIFSAMSYSWRVLVSDDKVIGDWHFVCLNDDVFERAKLGILRDSQITVTDLDIPIVGGERSYKMYIANFGVERRYRHPEAFNALCGSFVDEIVRLAEQDVFFSEVCATAWTVEGQRLCRLIGMEQIAKLRGVAGMPAADVFFSAWSGLLRAGFVQRNEKLTALYRSHFGRD